MRSVCQIFLFLLCLISTTSWAEQLLLIEPDMGRAPIAHFIRDANSSVDLVIYGFTDSQLLNALTSAKSAGKNVRVLLQHYPYKTEDENQAIIAKLQQANINLVWPDGDFKLTHQKTLLTDHHAALIMTFNFTHSTFKNERNFALITTDPETVNEIQQVFNADWVHKKTAVQQPDLIWSPDNSRTKILALINSAKSDIHVYAEGLTDYQIVGALAKAARAGVKVFVLTSPNQDHPQSKQFDYLQKSGVALGYDKTYHIHAKVIMIDHQRAALGSINFTRPSLNQNRELDILTQDKNVIKELYAVFESDWHASLLSDAAPRNTDTSRLLLQSVRQIAKLAKLSHHRKRYSHFSVAKNALHSN